MITDLNIIINLLRDGGTAILSCSMTILSCLTVIAFILRVFIISRLQRPLERNKRLSKEILRSLKMTNIVLFSSALLITILTGICGMSIVGKLLMLPSGLTVSGINMQSSAYMFVMSPALILSGCLIVLTLRWVYKEFKGELDYTEENEEESLEANNHVK